MTEKRENSLAIVLDKHGTLILSLGSAVLYGYARLTIALFCQGLGISPVDLALSLEDYLVTATFWLLLLSTGVAGISLAATADMKSTGQGWRGVRGLPVSIFAWSLGTVIVTVVFALAAPNAPSTWFVAILVWPVILIGVARVVYSILGRRPEGRLWLLGAVTLALFSAGAALSWQAGRDVAAANTFDDPHLPMPIAVVTSSTTGIAEIDGVPRCYLRLGNTVLVGANGDRVVLPEPETFRPADCAAESDETS